MNYTNIEQSKKLLELGMSPESADMMYVQKQGVPIIKNDCFAIELDLPCWSVGALLELLPKEIKYEDSMCYRHIDTNFISYEGFDKYDTYCTLQPMVFDEKPLIELLYESTIWLLENGYIEKGE